MSKEISQSKLEVLAMEYLFRAFISICRDLGLI